MILWWGSFQSPNRPHYTTQQFHTTQPCRGDNVFWDVRQNIGSPSEGFASESAHPLTFWKKRFERAFQKCTTHCIIVIADTTWPQFYYFAGKQESPSTEQCLLFVSSTHNHIHLLPLQGSTSWLNFPYVLVIWFLVFCQNALLNSCLTFFFFFTVDVAALDIQSKRSIAQQSDPSPKPGTLSLSRTKAELTRKQHCGSSFLAAVCLTVQSVIYSTYARTHTRMHNTKTQTVNTPSG